MVWPQNFPQYSSAGKIQPPLALFMPSGIIVQLHKIYNTNRRCDSKEAEMSIKDIQLSVKKSFGKVMSGSKGAHVQCKDIAKRLR